jgi:hypothetical protein
MRKRISKIEVETIVLILISILCWLIIQPLPSNPLQERELIKAFWKGMKEEEMLKRARKSDLSIQAVYTKNEAPKDYFFEFREGKRRVIEHNITNKVYIFDVRHHFVLYCWINEKGFIEDLRGMVHYED